MGWATVLIASGITAAIVLMSPPCVAQGTPSVAANSPQYVKGSLCTQPDQVVLSCPLAKNGKIVSVCAAGNTSPHTFYYAFGKPQAIEMRYLSDPATSTDSLFRSHLMFAGDTGGYAYSFVNNGIKYIIYTISGRYGFERSGVIVQKQGSLRALANMECSKGKVNETLNDSLFDETTKLKGDRDLEDHGLPHTE
jgi:hypothetical protein